MTSPFGAPPPRKPSILDRVAARLFPTASYTGLLDPSQQEGLSRQGLLQVGLNLMQAGGASPHQQGTLANIGSSIQGVDFPGMAQNALKVQAYRTQQQDEQAVAQAVARHPAKPGETQGDAYNRLTAIMTEIATIPGAVGIAEKMAPILSALKPDRSTQPREPMRVEGTNTKLGTPFVGREGTLLIDPVSLQQVGFIPKSQNQTKVTPQQSQHAEFGAGALAAWRTVESIRQKNPGVEQEVGKIMTSPAFVSAIPGFRHSSDAVLALQKAGASTAAQNYMRAKWPFLDNIIRTRIPGGRMNGQYMAQVSQEFMPGLDTEANAQMRANEIQAILTAQGESDFDQNPDIWNRAVKRHGVANMDLQAILNGGGIDQRINDMHSRYPQ